MTLQELAAAAGLTIQPGQARLELTKCPDCGAEGAYATQIGERLTAKCPGCGKRWRSDEIDVLAEKLGEACTQMASEGGQPPIESSPVAEAESKDAVVDDVDDAASAESDNVANLLLSAAAAPEAADDPPAVTGPRQPLKADNAAIDRALRLLCAPGEVYELRALDTGHGTISGYFDAEPSLSRAAAECTDRLHAGGVYITVNPTIRKVLARSANQLKHYAKHTTGDAEIASRRWLPLDFDPARPSGISASHEEHVAALMRAREVRDLLRDRGWPEPLLVDSGNGAYLLHRIELPNDDPARDLVKQALEALAALTDDDRVCLDKTMFNAARIVRVAGTINRKGDDVAERPHRQARILEAPATVEIVSREQLEALATLLPKPEPYKSSRGRGEFKLDSFFEQHGIAIKRTASYQGGRRLILEHCVFDESHRGTSAAIIELASGATVYSCRHNSCANKRWQDVRELFEPGYRARQEHPLVRSTPNRELANPNIGEMPTAAAFLAQHRKRISKPVIVEGALLAGSFNMLVGRPFSGKSSWAAALTRAIHRGDNFCGRQCTKSKVAYFGLERSGAGVAELFEKGASPRKFATKVKYPSPTRRPISSAESGNAACNSSWSTTSNMPPG